MLTAAAGVTPAALALIGIGQGVFAVPFFTTALHRVRPPETGSAAGLLNAVQQLGATLGTIIAGIIIGPEVLGLVKDPENLAAVSEIGIALLALAIVASLLVGADNMAFLGDVVGNITALVSSLGSAGLAGLITLGVVLHLLQK